MELALRRGEDPVAAMGRLQEESLRLQEERSRTMSARMQGRLHAVTLFQSAGEMSRIQSFWSQRRSGGVKHTFFWDGIFPR